MKAHAEAPLTRTSGTLSELACVVEVECTSAWNIAVVEPVLDVVSALRVPIHFIQWSNEVGVLKYFTPSFWGQIEISKRMICSSGALINRYERRFTGQALKTGISVASQSN
jgi:hypothetical protein